MATEARVLLAIPGYRCTFARAVPARDQIIVEAVQAGVLSTITNPIGMNVHQARNAVFHEAACGDFTHVYFVDDDVHPPPGCLMKLLAHDKPVVAALYPLRINGRKKWSVWDWWGENDEAMLFDYGVGFDQGALLHDALLRVGGAGTGCMLIQADTVKYVLERDPAPFQSPDEIEGGKIANISDDVYFARVLRSFEIPVFADVHLVCKHFGVVELGEESI